MYLRRNEAEWKASDSWELARLIFAVTLFVLATGIILATCGCASHMDQALSAEAQYDKAKKNDDLAKAAKLMRLSDYGQEAKYAVSLMPISPERNATSEILSLQIDLAGAGKMSESQRQAFVTALIKDDLKAHRLLYQAGQNDKKIDATIISKDAALAAKDEVIKAVLKTSSTVADEADKWIHYFLWFCAIVFIYFAIRMVLLWSQTAAVVATKVP